MAIIAGLHGRFNRAAMRDHVGRYGSQSSWHFAMTVMHILYRELRIADDTIDVVDVRNVRDVDVAYIDGAGVIRGHVDFARSKREPTDVGAITDADGDVQAG
jgi:hypothetical protein